MIPAAVIIGGSMLASVQLWKDKGGEAFAVLVWTAALAYLVA